MAKVVSVTDGATIEMSNVGQGQVKIRLYGIDTPEKGQPHGKAARKHLASLVAGSCR
jgi:micrococcal nuclease